MAFADKVLTCKDCGSEFVFTASEQEFFAEKGFENEPSRCKDCRVARKQSSRNQLGPRRMFDVTCATCGKRTQVPFQPSDNRPVYCSDCYSAQSPRRSSNSSRHRSY